MHALKTLGRQRCETPESRENFQEETRRGPPPPPLSIAHHRIRDAEGEGGDRSSRLSGLARSPPKGSTVLQWGTAVADRLNATSSPGRRVRRTID
jgi:hypothetical protein